MSQLHYSLHASKEFDYALLNGGKQLPFRVCIFLPQDHPPSLAHRRMAKTMGLKTELLFGICALKKLTSQVDALLAQPLNSSRLLDCHEMRSHFESRPKRVDILSYKSQSEPAKIAIHSFGEY